MISEFNVVLYLIEFLIAMSSTHHRMGRSLVQEFIIDDFKMAVQAVFDKALAGDETE